MKLSSVIIGMSLLAGTSSFAATTINIPDGSFEGLSATINAPLIGVSSNNVGAWAVQYSAVLALGGQLKADTAAALSGPTPTAGASEIKLSMPAGVGVTALLTQTLTNKYQPNSIYTLKMDLSEGSVANLIGGTTLGFMVGGTPVSSMSGAALANVLNSDSGFHTVTFAYKTGNTASNANVTIGMASSSVLGVGGDIFMDNVQLTVEPIQVNLSSLSTSSTNMSLVGTGGAPNASYMIATSTNFTDPAGWSMMATNQFDANGNFNFNIAVDPNMPAKYYRTVIP